MPALSVQRKKTRPVVREALAVVEKRSKKSPAKTMRRFFDAGIVSRSEAPVVAAGSIRTPSVLLNAADFHPETVIRIEPGLPSPKAEGAKKAPKRRGLFKSGILLGALAVSAVGVSYSSVPPGLAANSVISIGMAVGAIWFGRGIVRGFFRRGPPKKRSLRAGVALGLLWASFNLAYPYGLMQTQLKTADAVQWAWEVSTPKSWRGGNVDKVLEVITETREIESLPADFGNTVAKILAENPEGRKVLEKLRDRSGKLRLPDLYVAEVGAGTGARYISIYESVYINPSYLKSAGVTLAEVRAGPEAATKLIRHIEVTLFHEFHHASQFRRSLIVPGMLEKFPTQLHKVLSLQTEYQTHITEQRYVHEKLKADPSAQLKSYELSEYESFLKDFEAFLKGIENSHTYRYFSNIDSKYYESFLAEERAIHDARAVEGYLNIARRAAAKNSFWKAKISFAWAKERAARAGLPIPSKPY
ncbi:MAG: hypothetical protein COB53_01225 [Elusimicrobia bacterium]|nr:MAG: hypothetical protein COB53_01225 [Elusimicrobiota bacterium]